MSNMPIDPILSTADPMSLDTLMKLDPLKMTVRHREAIILELRKARVEWSKVEEAKRAGGTRSEKSAAKIAAKEQAKKEAGDLLADLLGGL